MSLVKGKTGEWEVIIGLEVHAQVVSKSKLFSSSSTEFGGNPNSHVALLDAGMPGLLPVLNRFCVEQAIRTGIAINGTINNLSVFDRKNYFYPDLPLGYQISQFHHPIVSKGHIKIDMSYGERTIGITRIHLEQDAGKSLHDQSPSHSYIDLNRAGVALMEIVSEPDLRSSEEAAEYMKKLRSIVRYIGSCDGDMEKGNLRCDANVSVRRLGEPLGTRCEVKNLNSIKNITKAIEYEITRQIDIIESGGKIDQETRLYDANLDQTRTMRSKEDAMDYRYFPDPDLLPLYVNQSEIEAIRKTIPELPDQLVARYTTQYNLNLYDAKVLTSEREVASYFEKAAALAEPKLCANWILVELFARLNKAGLEISSSPVSPENLAELVNLISLGTISGKIAKDVFEEMFDTKAKASDIVKTKGLTQVSDEGAIRAIVQKVLDSNQDKLMEYRSGKDKLFGFFVGQVMKESSGKANPKLVNDLLLELTQE